MVRGGNIFMIGVLLLGAYVTSLVMSDAETSPNVVYVDDDFNESTPGWGEDHFASIQAAIENASSGDTIKVYDGEYDGPVVINKCIRLIGDPIIDGHGGIAISIEANNTLIENFTIHNASIGIYAHNDSFVLQNIIVNNCTIYNESGDGAVLRKVGYNK